MLEGAVALATVDDNRIDASFMEQLHPVPVLWTCANGCSYNKSLLGVFGCQRKLSILVEILPRHQRCQLACLAYYGKLPLLALLEGCISSSKLYALFSCDQVLHWCHDLSNGDGAAVGDKVGVPFCDKPEQGRAHHAIFCHWEPCEATLGSQPVKIFEQHVWLDAHGVKNEATLILLHLQDLLDLLVHRQVGVNDANASMQSHSNGHL
mmetsp:Transcript_72056/g.134708  ORF Transcript_72056/g.134708 Transcript_72056/m.134708 type:complete len:208 (+) Transcript_72056:963-1586(+)